MKPIDVLIVILFLPAIILGLGYLYMFENNLCGPISSIFCLGMNWVTDVVVIPAVIFTGAAGLFFLCRRLKTEEI